MSISDIRAFVAERSALADLGRQQESRAEIQSNRQATGVQGSRVSLSTSLNISSQSFIGARVLTNGFNQSLNVSEQRPNFSLPEANQQSLFDFEEVARNVLGFVSSVIQGAQARGEDDEELSSLFEQARRGVATGIGQAIDDLEGFLDDDIQAGIDNSRNLIEDGISGLEQNIFGTPAQNVPQVVENETRVEQSISISDQRSGDLRIRTRDGDEVRIRFEDLQQFQLTQSLLIQTREERANQADQEQASESAGNQEPDVSANNGGTQVPVFENGGSNTFNEQPASAPAVATNEIPEFEGNPAPLINVQDAPQLAVPELTGEDVVAQAPEVQANANEVDTPTIDEEVVLAQNIEFESNSLFFESSSFSFSVRGELDEEELRAIGNLVTDTASLATEFFDGDVDAAFEQALELGFDETELTGFALQLDSIQQTRVTQTYESVSQFSEGDEGNQQERISSVRPISDYLTDLLSVFEQSRQSLQNGEAFNNLINDVFARVLEIETPDLVNTLNRFNSFNERLLSNLPEGIDANSEEEQSVTQ